MKQSIRVISWFLITSFSFHEFACAGAIEPAVAQRQLFAKPALELKLPESIAALESSRGLKGPLTVYLLQDAHTNSSSQLNTAKTLEFLSDQEKIRYVFLEGGTGDD